jgi:hypothetical protein
VTSDHGSAGHDAHKMFKHYFFSRSCFHPYFVSDEVAMSSFQTNVKGAELLRGFGVEPEVDPCDELDQCPGDRTDSGSKTMIASYRSGSGEKIGHIEPQRVKPGDDQYSKSD